MIVGRFELRIWLTSALLLASLSFSLSHGSRAIADTEPGLTGTTHEKVERLCPEGSAFHNETNACHKLLEQGPCGELQAFYSVSHTQNSNYGICSCVANPDGCNKKVALNRMVLPGPDAKQCFLAYSQGPCKEDEWYVLNVGTKLAECEQNPCSNKSISDEVQTRKPTSNEDEYVFVRESVCYKTYTKAFCPPDQYAQFVGTHNPNPKCFRLNAGPPMCLFSVGSSAGLPCETGYKLVGDDCVKYAEFD